MKTNDLEIADLVECLISSDCGEIKREMLKELSNNKGDDEDE